jgi:hypothetical protein
LSLSVFLSAGVEICDVALGAVWRQCLHFSREREIPGYGRLSIWVKQMLLLLLPLPLLLLLLSVLFNFSLPN